MAPQSLWLNGACALFTALPGEERMAFPFRLTDEESKGNPSKAVQARNQPPQALNPERLQSWPCHLLSPRGCIHHHLQGSGHRGLLEEEDTKAFKELNTEQEMIF